MTARYCLFVLTLLLSACQTSQNGNRSTGSCAQGSIAYPLQTGQKIIFSSRDLATNHLRYDDGMDQIGASRLFDASKGGMVTDGRYGLIWQDNEAALVDNANDAEGYCENLTLGGYADWRLPNSYELLTLVNLGASTNTKESAFKMMPYGDYYSADRLKQAQKVYMLRVERNDFTINLAGEIATPTSPYGVLISRLQNPSYTNDGFLSSLSIKEIYRNEENTTTVETIKSYDSDSGLPLTQQTFVSIEPNPYGVIQEPAINRYVKCVRGAALDLGYFERDAQKEVVSDRRTGRMWQDSLDVVDRTLRWGDAIDYCATLDLGGYKDWRLPTISELASIVNYREESDFVLHDAFRYNCPCRYHSSSNGCFEEEERFCQQANYQLNTCGPIDERIERNAQIHENAYDLNNTEPYFRVRCVRCGAAS
ncbi:MAG: DUF1566 domain-containing protein [Campylobacterales bacterium]|nr:DUF1566 domain-containing protein [Campylobacterales bacterium]